MLRTLLCTALLCLSYSFAQAQDIVDIDAEVEMLPCYPDCTLEEELEYSELLQEWQFTDLGLDIFESFSDEEQFDVQKSSANELYAKLARSAQSVSDFPYSALKAQVEFFFRYSSSINNKNYLVLIDFRQASRNRRMFIFNTSSGQMTSHYTSHGVNSGRLYATKFSNIMGSKQSTLGFLVSGTTYYGKNGKSLNLHGLESRNNRAFERRIVVHKASYVSADYIRRNGMVGNSWGCPAVENQEHYLVDRLSGGVLFYKFYN